MKNNENMMSDVVTNHGCKTLKISDLQELLESRRTTTQLVSRNDSNFLRTRASNPIAGDIPESKHSQPVAIS